MNLAETIYQHSLNLPETAAREALDFIEFLEQRYVPIPVNTKQQNDTEAFLSAIAGGLSDDFPDDIFAGYQAAIALLKEHPQMLNHVRGVGRSSLLVKRHTSTSAFHN